jgi:ornithine cyclodeaminase
MLHELLGDAIAEIVLYDVRGIDPETIDEAFREKTFVAGSWREAYAAATVFVTCTSSLEPYIDLPPAPGSLHLNVSLRDYRAECCDYFRGGIIVDDWTEVCREKTDIEMMHLHRNLNREDTRSIADVVERGVLGVGPEVPVFFNPMGMAVFDIAIATYYCRLASRQHIGVMLGAEVSQ